MMKSKICLYCEYDLDMSQFFKNGRYLKMCFECRQYKTEKRNEYICIHKKNKYRCEKCIVKIDSKFIESLRKNIFQK